MEKQLSESSDLKSKLALANEELSKATTRITKLEEQLNDKPPIINLTDSAANRYNFDSGSAELNSEFLVELQKEVFPDMKIIINKYKAIDTLEFVGHTDGTELSRKSNFDTMLPEYLEKKSQLSSLRPGSNVDLGLLRALAVKAAWLDWMPSLNTEDQSRLNKIDVRCYSAAQTLPPAGVSSFRGKNANSRRIEVRFTQLKE